MVRVMEQSIPSAWFLLTEHRGMADLPQHCLAIPKDLDRLEKQADGKLLEFKQGSAKPCSSVGTVPVTRKCWGLPIWKAA